MDESSYSHCPNCLAEYRPGFDTCHDCGIALVHGPAPVASDDPDERREADDTAVDEDARTIVLCRLPTLQAEVLASKLRAEGIVVAVDDPPLQMVYGPIISNAEPPRVWVLESQLDEARKIAKRAFAGDDAI
jgi:hypothetical protein